MKTISITMTAEHNLSVLECFPDLYEEDAGEDGGPAGGWNAQTVLDTLTEDGFGKWDLDAYGFEVTVEVFDGINYGPESTARGTVRS